MIEVKFRNEDEESVFMSHDDWMWNDPKAIAEAIAEDERNHSGGDLYDTNCWPRTYEIEMNGEWVKVSVDMEYSPDFSASLVNVKMRHPAHRTRLTRSAKMDCLHRLVLTLFFQKIINGSMRYLQPTI